MNRDKFFAAIRVNPFRGNLSQPAVDSINLVFDEWNRRKLTDLRWLAYMLATMLAEVGTKMVPVREGFKKSDAESRAFVRSRGYAYAASVGGHVYYGRGLVQCTWVANYKNMGAILGIDLVNNPDLALETPIAIQMMFEGMLRGTYTGKSLASYFNATKEDWANARRIINGTDRAIEIANYGKAFHTALILANDGTKDVIPPPPDIEPTNPKPKRNWITALVEGVAAILRKVKR